MSWFWWSIVGREERSFVRPEFFKSTLFSVDLLSSRKSTLAMYDVIVINLDYYNVKHLLETSDYENFKWLTTKWLLKRKTMHDSFHKRPIFIRQVALISCSWIKYLLKIKAKRRHIEPWARVVAAGIYYQANEMKFSGREQQRRINKVHHISMRSGCLSSVT